MPRKLKRLVLSTVRRFGGVKAHNDLATALGGVGCIFAMHRVVAQKTDSPAHNLTITAAFLDESLALLRDAGAEFITLAALGQRLKSGAPFERPAVCLTFDDGYRDNLTLALPILRKHQAPATIFTPSGAPDRTMDVWFLRLEKAVTVLDEIRPPFPGLPPVIATRTRFQKFDAYMQISRYVHSDIIRNRQRIAELLPRAKFSDEAIAAEHLMSWDELREAAADPLIAIGGHTVNHPVLSALDEQEALREMTAGRERLAAQLDRCVTLFSYPYGGRDEIRRREIGLAERAGFDLAVAMRYDQVQLRDGAKPFKIPRMTLGGPREDVRSLMFDVLGCITPDFARQAQPFDDDRPEGLPRPSPHCNGRICD